MTHDYKRNGTTTLFAALTVLTGSVIGQCLPRHRHSEFLTFLRTIDREVPNGLQIHLILDNYATHKHPNVNAWLAKHPRFHLHFTPTSSSWVNMIEGFFAQLTNKAIRRGAFGSVPDLIAAIDAYLTANNTNPTPFTWTKTAEQIVEKVQRGRLTLNFTAAERGVRARPARRTDERELVATVQRLTGRSVSMFLGGILGESWVRCSCSSPTGHQSSPARTFDTPRRG
jgi:transposase